LALSITEDEAAFLEVVRDLRPELSADLDPDDLAALDELLAEQPPDQRVVEAIRELLKTRTTAQNLVAEEFIRTYYEAFRGVDPLPGPFRPVGADAFRCEEEGCKERWRQQRPGQKPPRCPVHDVALKPVPLLY
jgi:hypothetical protein